jgi:hypothetical protein
MPSGYAKAENIRYIEAALDAEEVEPGGAGTSMRLDLYLASIHAALDAKSATGTTILEKIDSLSEPA